MSRRGALRVTVKLQKDSANWVVALGGHYLWHSYYRGDADALASRLRRVLKDWQAEQEEGETP